MSLLVWIILFCLAGGLLSVLVAALFLLLPERHSRPVVPHLVSFAVGALLGAAFIGLLPHALEAPGITDSHPVTLTVLGGLLLFFVLEKMVLWRHCHSDHCVAHTPHAHHGRRESAATLILIGDGIHNFVDGVLIAAAFLTDFHLGVVTALAVAAHEIPQELGDFAILLHGGMGRGRALAWNLVSGLVTVVGGVVGYLGLGEATRLLPYVLAVAAASFIYIAVADLIPGLHERTRPRETLTQLGLIGAGILVIYLAHATLH